MRERTLRSILLVKAIEDADTSGALITPAERVTASKEARRHGTAGADTSPGDAPSAALSAASQRMLARRADILGARLVERHPFITAVRDASGGPAYVTLLVIGLALLLGLGLSSLDGTQRINLLAPGLIGLVAWNFAVYLWLLIRVIRHRGATKARPLARVLAHNGTSTMLRLIARSAAFNAPLAAALKSYSTEWLDAARPLLLARATRLMHLAAAAIGAGLIGGLYARGVAVDYFVGWESTFLDATNVRRVFQVLYGPASAVSGIALPDAAQVDALRWTGEGTGGERAAGGTGVAGAAGVAGGGAARWIHLLAWTVALYVVIPRLALAALATASIARWSWRMPLPVSLPSYFRRVFSAVDSTIGRGIVMVAPYAHAVSPEAIARLRELLPAAFGADLAVDLREPIVYGGEEAFVRNLADRGGTIADVFVLLFNLASTPEDENHGALLSSVRDWLSSNRRGAQLLVLLDAGPYAARMATHGDRVDERRRAWETFVADRGLPVTMIDLASPHDDNDAAVTALRKSLWQPGQPGQPGDSGQPERVA